MKKPKVWDIAVLTGIVLMIFTILQLRGKGGQVPLINGILIVYFVCAVGMLIYAFVKQVRYNLYSYNTIYYVGFAIFLLSVISTHIRMGISMAENPDNYNIPTLISTLSGSGQLYMIVTFPFILLFSLALCVSNISLIRHEGRRPVNMLGILLSILMVGGALVLFFAGRYMTGSMEEVMRKDLVLQILTTLYLYCECMLIGAIVASVMAALRRPAYDKDYVIILGCGINDDGTPTPLLRGRADEALEFAKEQKGATDREPLFVTSGGQGPDEAISESECMKRYLMSRGVSEDRIIEENRSETTFENMKFTKEKLESLGVDTQNTKVAFSTTNYHVFRSGLYAKRNKLQAEGMGADTKWYFWPNAAVRELVGLMTEHRGKQALVLGGMIIIYATLTVISFMY